MEWLRRGREDGIHRAAAFKLALALAAAAHPRVRVIEMEMAAHVLPVRRLQVGHHPTGVVRRGLREGSEPSESSSEPAPAVFPAAPHRLEVLALRRARDLQIRTREALPIF